MLELLMKYHDEFYSDFFKKWRDKRNTSVFGYDGQMSDVNSCLTYAIIREYKPKLILEMSSSRGYTTGYICEAVKLNENGGKVIGIEPGYELHGDEPTNHHKLNKLRKNIAPWKSIYSLIEQNNETALPDVCNRGLMFDLIFIDSEHSADTAKLYTETYPLFDKYLNNGGWMHIHDIYEHSQEEGPYIINWIEDNHHKFSQVFNVNKWYDPEVIKSEFLGPCTGDNLEGAVWLKKQKEENC